MFSDNSESGVPAEIELDTPVDIGIRRSEFSSLTFVFVDVDSDDARQEECNFSIFL